MYIAVFQEPNSARQETKTADGVVRGSYNYVDDTGRIQTVEYVADAAGFRVAGTNIPVQELPVAPEALPASVEETPEVAAARDEHHRLFAEIAARNAELADLALQQQREAAAAAAAAPVPVPVAVPAQAPVVAAAPAVPAQQVPVVATAPAAVTASQYHAQDEQGQYNYGYATPDSSKVETRTSDGIVRGSYKYLDGEGEEE